MLCLVIGAPARYGAQSQRVLWALVSLISDDGKFDNVAAAAAAL